MRIIYDKADFAPCYFQRRMQQNPSGAQRFGLKQEANMDQDRAEHERRTEMRNKKMNQAKKKKERTKPNIRNTMSKMDSW